MSCETVTGIPAAKNERASLTATTRWSVKARALRQQRRERSALDIQRVARGRFGRNTARAIREERARILAERNSAAATIQKAWYDYQNSIRTKMA